MACESAHSAFQAAGLRRVKLEHVCAYFVLIPFLLPKGLAEISIEYKQVSTVWLYAAMAVMILQLFAMFYKSHVNFNWSGFAAASYFIVLILCTALVQIGFREGLQTLFAWPLLCLWLGLIFCKGPGFILNAAANILIVAFLLNFVFDILNFFESYLHLTFLGHVQMVAQEGVLAIVVATLLILGHFCGKAKPILLISFVIYACLSADADSSKVVLLVFVAGLAMAPTAISDWLGRNVTVLSFTGLLLSLFVVFLSVNSSSFLGISWDFSGRSFIWREVLSVFALHPLLGYGVQGVQLNLFWGSSMNYAHNQLMQCLIDGGIVALLLFVLMVLSYAHLVKNVGDKRIRYVFTMALLVFLFLMIFDSVSYYCYFFMFLPLVSYYIKKERARRYGSC